MRVTLKTKTAQLWHFMMYLSIASVACLLIYILSVSIPLVGPFSAMRNDAKPVRSSDYIHAIIFDGGSTGTRIHVFTFLKSSGNHLILEDEYFQEVRPGLSSYSENPPKAAASIIPLLDKAVDLVPSEKWNNTPVILKATAGLRLLPSDAADNILIEVKQLLQKYPFQVRDDSVSVMEGEDEGLYAWFTVNFLLDLLEDKRSVATLDLGGGSTQVTFAPNDLKTLVFSPKQYIIKRTIQAAPVVIYTHSYLGLGLMSARFEILQFTSPSNKDILNSPCIHPSAKKIWTYGGKTYTVRGMKSGRYNFDACYSQAVKVLNSTVDQPRELPRRTVFALSYYFDRAADIGLIDRQRGGNVTVGEYQAAAKTTCSKMNSKLPFLCMDSTYIVALLHHGLGLDLKKEIVLVKKIGGIETSWGLGAGYSALVQD